MATDTVLFAQRTNMDEKPVITSGMVCLQPFSWSMLIMELAGRKRASTFLAAVTLAEQLAVKSIVESGCIRGIRDDGLSTAILSLFSHRTGAEFHSTNVNQEHINICLDWLEPLHETRIACSDSVEYFSKLGLGTVGFAYLDSLDWEAANPDPSQLHQLNEVNALADKFTGTAIVLLDDAGLQGMGKTPRSSERLVELGFKLVIDEYQRLFVRSQ